MWNVVRLKQVLKRTEGGEQYLFCNSAAKAMQWGPSIQLHTLGLGRTEGRGTLPVRMDALGELDFKADTTDSYDVFKILLTFCLF